MFKMAIRNLLRNKKRSLLTISAIIIAIFGSTMIQGWIKGVGGMITEEGKRTSGHIRVTHTDYELSSKSLDISKNISYEQVENLFNNTKYNMTNTGRIRFGAIVFIGENDERILANGIEEKDYDIIGFDTFIYEGRFINFNTQGEIIVGSRVRERLNLQLGDLITVVSSTQYGSMSAFNYEIVGFYSMDNSQLNRSLYMSLEDAQYHLDMEGYITEYLVFLEDEKYTYPLYESIKDVDNLLILPWDKIGLNEYMSKILPVFLTVFLVILAILAGVGITNTMMMVVFERRKEIGVLKAQGMKNSSIRNLLCLEGITMGFLGSLIAVFLGGTIIYHYSKVGIDFGNMMETVSSEMNIKSVVYFYFGFDIFIISIVFGIFVSLASTLMAIEPELKKEAVENLRDN